MQPSKNKHSQFSNFLPFFIGGLSGMVATLVIHPIDTLKVQLQVVSEQYGKSNIKDRVSIFKTLKNIYQNKGLFIFYRGLESALLRQLIYASMRLGSYNFIIARLEERGKKVSLVDRSFISIISGALGALVGNPFDVALVRRQASVTTNKNHYKSTYEAFQSILKEDGILGLWAGLKITILRVLIINFGQLAAHDIIESFMKEYLQSYPMLMHNSSAILASLFTCLISLPADNIKVKLQKQGKKQIEYRGIWDCLVKTIKRQGILRLWVGFPIYVIRGAPHSFILIRTQQILLDLIKQKKY